MSNWERLGDTPLVIPKAPPEPPKSNYYVPREYILVCPRCYKPCEIGEEHESMYCFDCPCGGGRVNFTPLRSENHVKSIEWREGAPMLGTRQEPWKGYGATKERI